MIYGIGTDLVDVRRIGKSLERFGDVFAQRILGETELNEFQAVTDKVRFLAKRFAAKEAFSKALGTGMRHPLAWGSIEIAHDALGKPLFDIHTDIAKLLKQNRISRHHLSITDEKKYVCAFVILEQ